MFPDPIIERGETDNVVPKVSIFLKLVPVSDSVSNSKFMWDWIEIQFQIQSQIQFHIQFEIGFQIPEATQFHTWFQILFQIQFQIQVKI